VIRALVFGAVFSLGVAASPLITASISAAAGSTDPGICAVSGCPTIECNATTHECIYYAPDPTTAPSEEPAPSESVAPSDEPTAAPTEGPKPTAEPTTEPCAAGN